MKKLILILTLILPIYVTAQTTDEISETYFKKVENSKSGNYKDVLYSFLQAAIKSPNLNEKQIEFNSTLYKFLADNNKDILHNYSRNKILFLRNFQLNIKWDFDDNFKTKGFTGGATIAIINKRDKDFVDYSKTLLQVKYDEFLDYMQSANKGLLKAGVKDESLTTAGEIILNQEAVTVDIKEIVDAMKDSIQTYMDKNKIEDFIDSDGKTISLKDVDSFVKYTHSLKKKYEEEIDTKPLWTISSDGSTNTDGKFNKASVGTIFLVGNSKSSKELDLRAKLSYADTLQTVHLPRTLFNAKAGVNFKLAKNKDQQSFFEIKTYFEYNHLFNNLTSDEEKNVLLANADIRIRLMDDLWIPLTIKYDATDKGNIYGFLNVTYNFESLKKKTN